MADEQKGKKSGSKTVPESDRLAEGLTIGGTTTLRGEPRDIINFPDEPLKVSLSGSAVDVTLHGTPTGSTNVQGFWEYLRQRTDTITFNEYSKFIEDVLCKGAHDARRAR